MTRLQSRDRQSVCIGIYLYPSNPLTGFCQLDTWDTFDTRFKIFTANYASKLPTFIPLLGLPPSQGEFHWINTYPCVCNHPLNLYGRDRSLEDNYWGLLVYITINNAPKMKPFKKKKKRKIRKQVNTAVSLICALKDCVLLICRSSQRCLYWITSTTELK